jgi:hypothetical protein
MIIATKPILEEKKDETEVRKALQNLAEQMNKELQALEARVYALEHP